MCQHCNDETHIGIFTEGVRTGLSHNDHLDSYYPGLNLPDVSYNDMKKAVVIGSNGSIITGEQSFDKYIRELLEEMTSGLNRGNQKEHIENVLKKFSGRKFDPKEWWNGLTDDEIQEMLKGIKAYYLPQTQLLNNGLREAYLFGKFAKNLTENDSLSEARKKISNKALSRFDQARIEYIQKTSGLFWDKAISRETDNAAINLLKFNKDVTTGILQNLDQKAWRSLTSDIYHSINRDKALVMRDLDRIVKTETAYSQNYAILSGGLDRGSKYFFVKVRPTACRLCKDMYLDKDGRPKRFLISEFIDQPRDINWSKKPGDHVVQPPPRHPWCYCVIIIE